MLIGEQQLMEYKQTLVLEQQVLAAYIEIWDYVDAIIFQLRLNIADELYAAGRAPFFSQNVIGDLTCGYGALSSDGEWQFPLSYPEFYRGLAREEADVVRWEDQFLK